MRLLHGTIRIGDIEFPISDATFEEAAESPGESVKFQTDDVFGERTITGNLQMSPEAAEFFGNIIWEELPKDGLLRRVRDKLLARTLREERLRSAMSEMERWRR